VHGPGGATLVPEVLVRVDSGSELGDRLAAAADDGDEVAIALGRSADERVVCLRPAVTTPAVLRRRIDVILRASAAYVTGTSKAPEAQAA
jgi:hypothetical protein